MIDAKPWADRDKKPLTNITIGPAPNGEIHLWGNLPDGRRACFRKTRADKAKEAASEAPHRQEV